MRLYRTIMVLLVIIHSLMASTSINSIILSNLSNNWLSITIIILIALLSLVVLLFKGKMCIKLPGGASVDIGGSTDDKKPINKKQKNNVNPHSECPYAIDFKHVFTKTTYIVSKISEIKYRGCLQEQMSYTEEQFVNIKTMYQKSYLEKLNSNLKEKGEVNTEYKYLYQDYRYYQAIIKLMIHDMESVVRASFSNNHLITYEPEDYQRYIDLKFNVIKALEIDFIDTMYIGEWIVSRDEIFEIHRINRKELQSIIEDVYTRARKIAFSKKNEIEKLEEEAEDFMNYTVGNNIKIEKTTVAR